MRKPLLKIAIATAGRFHVLDLARELHRQGLQVRFYSYVPTGRAAKFGLPVECQRSLLFYSFPLVLLGRFGPKFLKKIVNQWLTVWMDWLISRKLEECDFFIGMSGLCVRSAKVARKKYGAIVLVERGSTHILRQAEILKTLQRKGVKVEKVTPFDIKRELESYKLADLMVIPSLHTEESFVDFGITKKKLFRNPYGVDLEMFPPTSSPDIQKPTVLYVGAWSYRKGCDSLKAAIEQMEDIRFIHVGGLEGAPLPTSKNFTHFDPVPQWELREYYAMAHVFVLASREEGLSLVLLQALSCGLPLVCTDMTGGRDLKEIVGETNMVRVIPPDHLQSLVDGIRKGLMVALKRKGLRVLPEKARLQLSWKGYGERYFKKLVELCGDRGKR